MELKEFIIKTLEQVTTHVVTDVIDFDIAASHKHGEILVFSDPGENRLASRVKFSVKIMPVMKGKE